MTPLRIAWLTTGRGAGSHGALEHLFRSIDHGLPVEVGVVFVNHDPGEAEATDRLMDLVRARGVPLESLSSVRFRKDRGGKVSRPGEPLQPWRLDYDAAVADRLARHRFGLGVMFGYMLVASPPLHERFTFLNDHPALPDGPVGPYQEVIAALIRTGARESGCMTNLVTAAVDRGPAVSCCRFPIRDADNEALWDDATLAAAMSTDALRQTPLYADIRVRGVERERPFLVETLRAIALGRLVLVPTEPLDLSLPVELAVRAATVEGGRSPVGS